MEFTGDERYVGNVSIRYIVDSTRGNCSHSLVGDYCSVFRLITDQITIDASAGALNEVTDLNEAYKFRRSDNG